MAHRGNRELCMYGRYWRAHVVIGTRDNHCYSTRPYNSSGCFPVLNCSFPCNLKSDRMQLASNYHKHTTIVYKQANSFDRQFVQKRTKVQSKPRGSVPGKNKQLTISIIDNQTYELETRDKALMLISRHL